MSPTTNSEPKQYGLTTHESNMLSYVNDHQNAIFSGLLSTIVGSRLGYKVTERTQFQLSGDFKTITVMELSIPEEAKAPVEGSPVVTAPETAQEAPSEPTTSDTQVSEPVATNVTTQTAENPSEAVETTKAEEPSEPATQLAPAEAQPAQTTEPQAS